MRHLTSIHSCAFAITALLATLACASTSSSGDDQPQTNVTTRQLSSPGGRPIETTDMNGTDYVPVKGTRVEALTALTQIYAQMQIPIAMMVPDAGQIGNQNLRLATHRLHGHLVSFYLNCGQESMAGSRADLDEITISVLTNVRRSRDSLTVVGTTVQGWARPSGTSSNAVDCETTGELEKAIASAAQTALGVPTAKSE
jgi:hypothetical protein